MQRVSQALIVASLLAASILVEAQMQKPFGLGRRVLQIVSREGEPRGTAFRICQPSVVLTATHVIEGLDPTEVRVSMPFIISGQGVTFAPLSLAFAPVQIIKHPTSDVAALFLKEGEASMLECFELGVPSDEFPGLSSYPIGLNVASFGFPVLERPIRPRLSKGHIQSYFEYKGYQAYELAFPAFGGMSGSPIFREDRMDIVIGVVTTSITYASLPGQVARADWAIGAALPPLAAWLGSLSTAY